MLGRKGAQPIRDEEITNRRPGPKLATSAAVDAHAVVTVTAAVTLVPAHTLHALAAPPLVT